MINVYFIEWQEKSSEMELELSPFGHTFLQLFCTVLQNHININYTRIVAFDYFTMHAQKISCAYFHSLLIKCPNEWAQPCRYRSF